MSDAATLFAPRYRSPRGLLASSFALLVAGVVLDLHPAHPHLATLAPAGVLSLVTAWVVHRRSSNLARHLLLCIDELPRPRRGWGSAAARLVESRRRRQSPPTLGLHDHVSRTDTAIVLVILTSPASLVLASFVPGLLLFVVIAIILALTFTEDAEGRTLQPLSLKITEQQLALLNGAVEAPR